MKYCRKCGGDVANHSNYIYCFKCRLKVYKRLGKKIPMNKPKPLNNSKPINKL